MLRYIIKAQHKKFLTMQAQEAEVAAQRKSTAAEAEIRQQV